MNNTTHLKIKNLSPLLLVSELEASIQFYNRLGFETAFRYEDFYAGIAKDGYTIHLKSGKPAKADRESRRKNEDLDIVFSVEAIAGLYEALMNMPVNIIQSLREMPYGREFYVTDPDGYILGFVAEN
jgi:catechol 2,3-dioxygenase-like lactoylglutathione lyase family enzyme